MIDGLCDFCKKWLLAALVTDMDHWLAVSTDVHDDWRSEEDVKTNFRINGGTCWFCIHVVAEVLSGSKRSSLDWHHPCSWIIPMNVDLPGYRLQLTLDRRDWEYDATVDGRFYGRKAIMDASDEDKQRTERPCTEIKMNQADLYYRVTRPDSLEGSGFDLTRADTSGQGYVARVGQTVHAVSDFGMSSEGIDMISAWLTRCREDGSCDTRGMADPEGRFVPKRLLRLTESRIQLVESSQLYQPDLSEYATLSHCWGRDPFLTLTAENMREFNDNVPMAKLGKTFRDAISLCLALHIKYLWIDSLCIIQDVEHARDWLEHAPIMGRVYANSILNIAACSAQACSDGLVWRSDTGFYKDLIIDVPWKDTVHRYGLRPEIMSKAVRQDCEGQPLFQRSWCVQELLLANRVVYITENIISCVCANHKSHNLGQTFLPWKYGIGHFQSGLRTMKLAAKLGRLEVDELDQQWLEIGNDFAKTSATVKGDRIYALAGLAAWFGAHYRELGVKTQYCAGCWEHSLEKQLVWGGTKTRGLGILDWAHEISIPWWSWMSATYAPFERASRGRYNRKEMLLQVVRLDTVLQHPGLLYGPMGKIELLVRSRLCSLQLRAQPDLPTPIPSEQFFWDVDGQGGLSARFVDGTSFESPGSTPCGCGRYHHESDSVSGSIKFDSLGAARDFRASNNSCHCAFVQETGRAAQFLYAIVLTPHGRHPSDGFQCFRRIGMLRYETWCYDFYKTCMQPLGNVLVPDVDDGNNELYLV